MNLFCRSKTLLEVQHWLKTVPALNLEPVKCGSISLDDPVVEAIGEAVQQTKVKPSCGTQCTLLSHVMEVNETVCTGLT